MGKGRRLLERMAAGTDMDGQELTYRPIVEILDTQRVLIENHFGIMRYSREEILVKVHFGCIRICGSAMEVLCMSRDQLVIRGKICGVSLLGRGEL